MLRAWGDIINLWPSAVAYAADIGTTPVNARAFRRRGIPSRHWQATVAAAAARGYAGVSMELLASLAARRHGALGRPVPQSSPRPCGRAS